MRIKIAIGIISGVMLAALIPNSLNAQAQDFGTTRQPLTCSSRTAPKKGAPSLEQVRRYFTCDNEAGNNTYPGITTLLLIDDLNIEVSPRGRRPNARDVMYETIKGVRIEMAPDRLVYDIRGTYTNYFCRSGGFFQPGKNCRVDKYTGSTGICYQSNFGEWHCLMYGDIKPVGDKLPPPSGSSASAPPVIEKPETTPVNSPQPANRDVDPVRSFANLCKDKSLTVDMRYTVNVLLKEVGTSDCSEADLKLNRLKSLELNNKKISNLSPIGALTNLKDLNLTNNQISDLRPLENLTELIALSLSRNQISNVRPLSYLTKLKGLFIANNQLKDVTSLATLTNLQYLNLHSNKISEVNSLATLTNLKGLFLYNNRLSNKACPVNLASICNFTDNIKQ
jgi:hypothetical protein